MANDMRYLSAEEEAKLLKPIDEYVGKIQAQIDALRVDGSDQVQALKTHISLTKEDKNYTKEEQNEIIRKDQAKRAVHLGVGGLQKPMRKPQAERVKVRLRRGKPTLIP